jgi:hypothetical protein
MVVREWGPARAMARDQRGSRFRDWSQRQFQFAGRDRAVPMGSIDKYIFRATLASCAPVPVSLTTVTWIARAMRGTDPMIGQGPMIAAYLGFISMAIRPRALLQAISEPNARLPRLVGRPATA